MFVNFSSEINLTELLSNPADGKGVRWKGAGDWNNSNFESILFFTSDPRSTAQTMNTVSRRTVEQNRYCIMKLYGLFKIQIKVLVYIKNPVWATKPGDKKHETSPWANTITAPYERRRPLKWIHAINPIFVIIVDLIFICIIPHHTCGTILYADFITPKIENLGIILQINQWNFQTKNNVCGFRTHRIYRGWHANPVIGVLVFLPTSWIILNFLPRSWIFFHLMSRSWIFFHLSLKSWIS